MHVGNCTDGPADYQLAGDGFVIKPPDLTGDETFRLDADKQNLWTISGEKRVIFIVPGRPEIIVNNVTDSDIVVLFKCAGEYSAGKMTFAEHNEVTPG